MSVMRCWRQVPKDAKTWLQASTSLKRNNIGNFNLKRKQNNSLHEVALAEEEAASGGRDLP
jgi:hypothetical protein